MRTRDDDVQAVGDTQREGTAYWSAFGDDVFFQNIGQSVVALGNGAPSHQIHPRRDQGHDHAATRAAPDVRQAAPRVRDARRADHALPRPPRGGRKASRFTPSPQTDSDRSTILNRLSIANDELKKAIGRWSDADLDRYQMPHPLLGKFTVREMLFFTVYHQHHHMKVTSRRRAASASA